MAPFPGKRPRGATDAAGAERGAVAFSALVRNTGADVRLEQVLRPNLRVNVLKRYGWRAATLLAFLAQCWIAVAPLSESRGFGLSAHVENAGNHRGHFTHDEATCAACSVLSLHVLS